MDILYSILIDIAEAKTTYCLDFELGCFPSIDVFLTRRIGLFAVVAT